MSNLVVRISYLEHVINVSAGIGQKLCVQVINLVHCQRLDRTLFNLLRLHAHLWERHHIRHAHHHR